MREIKFRAWDIENAEMLYDSMEFGMRELGYGTTAKCDAPCKEGNGYIGFVSDCIKWHMMQYTGLKDKNGKEIYEGDIVRFVDIMVPELAACVVKWGVCLAASLGDDYTEMQGWVIEPEGYDVEPLFPFSCLEVIGNIYENKELLCELN